MIISISAKLGGGKDLTGQIIQYLMARKFHNIKYPVSEEDFNTFIKNNHHLTCSWEIKKFADKLKDMVCMMLECTREQLEDRVFKDTPLGKEWDKWEVTDNDPDCFSSYYFSTEEEALFALSIEGELYHAYNPKVEKIIMTPRILMQVLGTEAGRNIIHPNLWVICTMSGYKPDSKWIITDNRFPNEVKAVNQKNGLTFRIERDFNLRFPEYQNLEEVHTKDIDLYMQLVHFSEVALDSYTQFDYIIQNNGTVLDLINNVEQILIKENIL